MAIRFSSFELYKEWMADADGKVSTGSVFLGKLVDLCSGTYYTQ
jgi:solute carrier family 25 citrate transporter 1